MKTYHMISPQFLYNLVVYSFTSLACSLFFSYPHWFPSVCLSSLYHFLFTSIPNIYSFFCNPKCFFLVGNTIVLFLIGEWKFQGSQPSPAAEIYDQYALRARASRSVVSALPEAKAMDLEKNSLEDNLDKFEEEKQEKEDEEEKNSDEDGAEDEPALPDEELNRRVEEFLERINKQRWLEARLLVYDDNNTEDTHALPTD